jgi:hypothetical protein
MMRRMARATADNPGNLRRVIESPTFRHAVIAAAVIVIVVGAIAWVQRGRADRTALRLVSSPEPNARRRGAWLAAENHCPRAWQAMGDVLEAGSEREESVREAFVYALGRSSAPRLANIVADVATQESSSYVRQAAWRALARLDPDRFRKLAAERPPTAAAQERIGLAGAWLSLGDTRGVDTLLHFAAEGNHTERQIASQHLTRGLGPLLEAVGRWPADAAVSLTEPWDAALVAEVRRRVAVLDLQPIADSVHAASERSARVRRFFARIVRGRNRIAAMLGEDDAGTSGDRVAN